jgi:CheY-like chemotaxis protein
LSKRIIGRFGRTFDKMEIGGLALLDLVVCRALALEFARRLKANVATRATPIVAFTAYGDRWSEAETKAAGGDAFLEKPITANMLATAVRRVIERTS